MHKFFHFAHLKSTFSILHTYFYKTHISLSILHVYLNKIFISLPTQPLTHTHNPHRYHIRIHTTHWQKTRKTNPAKWIKTHTHNPHWYRTTIHTTQQKTRKTNPAKWIKTHTGIDASPWAKLIKMVSHRNRRLALSNKIDASNDDGENEKQDRHLQRQAVAMAMARDIQPKTHWSSPFNPKTTRNKGRKSDWRRQRRWQSTEARGRKIDERKKDWSDERKKERVVRLRERGSWELDTERREKKWLKNYMHML